MMFKILINIIYQSIDYDIPPLIDTILFSFSDILQSSAHHTAHRPPNSQAAAACWSQKVPALRGRLLRGLDTFLENVWNIFEQNPIFFWNFIMTAATIWFISKIWNKYSNSGRFIHSFIHYDNVVVMLWYKNYIIYLQYI